jgi:hypothetical protein
VGVKENEPTVPEAPKSDTKPAARMVNEQKIEDANFTNSFNVSMVLIFLGTKNLTANSDRDFYGRRSGTL